MGKWWRGCFILSILPEVLAIFAKQYPPKRLIASGAGSCKMIDMIKVAVGSRTPTEVFGP